ncbi:E3 ubiquitin-protein ligase TRIM17-like [Chelmon rostratus]|uniref:E3 ubiquitin-protein ligase TRIM17-like n=1 Tax=Chelmon rostratus TaxID=109905 RepID=UPI001BE5A653|nr:E3 ubiquitin-protein ligase TRIM17-like [Chelmon rostratus]
MTVTLLWASQVKRLRGEFGSNLFFSLTVQRSQKLRLTAELLSDQLNFFHHHQHSTVCSTHSVTDPVTLPCGHNFCKTCSQCLCPKCEERVDRKYKLGVNALISEMSVQFRQSAGRKVINVAIENKHGRPLELYCNDEQKSKCRSCADSNHRFHYIVPLKEEYEVKKTDLRKTEARIQQEMLERRLKTQIKRSLKFSREAADRAVAVGVQIFNALERAQAELIGMIEETQKTTEKQAKSFIQLDQEISELVRRRAEVEQLSRSKDHLHFLQSVPTLNPAPLTRDRIDVSVRPVLCGGLTRTAVVRAVDQLTDTESTVVMDGTNSQTTQNGLSLGKAGFLLSRVFVDHEEGLVSFYDVDAAALLYFDLLCSFTMKLHPL